MWQKKNNNVNLDFSPSFQRVVMLEVFAFQVTLLSK